MDVKREIQIWEGGELESANIGPARGEHLLGVCDEPGFYFLVDEHAGGKSQHLKLLAMLHDDRLLRAEAPITDGEMSAYLRFASAKVVFSRSPGGGVKAPKREGVETLPPITVLPQPIDELITGGHLDGDEPRARRRLQALLQYSPIESTKELVRALCAVLAGAAFAELPPAERLEAWNRLAAQAKEGASRFRAEPFATSEELLAYMIEEVPREGILEDQQALVNKLNKLGNTAEKAAGAQRNSVASAEGRLEQVLSAAGRGLSIAPGQALAKRLLEAPGVAEASAALRAAQDAAAEKRLQRKAKVDREAEREGLRASHGAKPDADQERRELATAKGALAKAVAGERSSAEAVAAARAAAEEGTPAFEAVVRELSAVKFDLDRDHVRLVEQLQAEPADRDLEPQIEAMRELYGRLQVTWARARLVQLRQRELSAARRAAEDAHQRAGTVLEAARAEVKRLEGLVEKASDRVAAWKATADLLAATIEGPTLEQVQAAEAAVTEAELADRVARSAADYQRAAAALQAERELLEWIDEVGAAYRAAAIGTWKALGQIVTDQLALPWLRVDGMRLRLMYDRGTGRLATAETLPDNVEERDLDDNDRVSSGELHEAMLELMLSRREALGGILILPWQVVLALDYKQERVFARRFRDAGLYVFSERTMREGDSPGLHLVKVSPATDAQLAGEWGGAA